MPAEWDFHKKMPNEIKDGIAANFKDDFVVLLTNPKTRGTIIVSADTTKQDIISLGIDKEAFKEKLLERIKEREEEFTKEYLYEDFNGVDWSAIGAS